MLKHLSQDVFTMLLYITCLTGKLCLTSRCYTAVIYRCALSMCLVRAVVGYAKSVVCLKFSARAEVFHSDYKNILCMKTFCNVQ